MHEVKSDHGGGRLGFVAFVVVTLLATITKKGKNK